MISVESVTSSITEMGITHLIWIPDSSLGKWESEFERSRLKLIRICREGEAWPLAAGLYAGGAKPLIMMQSTGLFESGDALRNAVYDLKCPLYAWIGVRNWLDPESHDSARHFIMPIIHAWQLEHVWLRSDDDLDVMVQHYWQCQTSAKAGLALLTEGAG